MANRLDASGYETDKALHAHYLRSYDQYFDKLQDQEVRLLVSLKRLINGRQFRSHDYGLVGFIKELVDECGMDDITRPARQASAAPFKVSGDANLTGSSFHRQSLRHNY